VGLGQGEGESFLSTRTAIMTPIGTGSAVTFETDHDRTPLDQQKMHIHQRALLQAPPQRLAQGRPRRLGEGGGVAPQ